MAATRDSIKGKVAIVGAADTEVGKVPHLSATQLLGMACVVAASGLVMGARSKPVATEALAETTNQ